MFSFQRRPGPLALFCAVLLLLTTLLWPMSRQSSSLPAAGDAAVAVSTDNWGLSFPTEGQSPVGNATVEELAQYNAYYLGDTSQKVIYLTFDCGYENGYTASILDTLKKHNAPAAFFVVGNMIESAPDLIRRMVAEGHIVGNHTYHHPDMSSISDQAAFQKELESLEALFQETTGQTMSKYYRPGKIQCGESAAGQGPGLQDHFVEPCVCGLVCGRPAHTGAGLFQAPAPYP